MQQHPPAIQGLFASSSNDHAFIQHLNTLISYVTSPKYKPEQLADSSKKVKLINQNSFQGAVFNAGAGLSKQISSVQALRLNNLMKKQVSDQELLYRDFACDSQLFSWIGVGFGPVLTLQINKSVTNLTVTHRNSFSSMRFWGRVSCSQRDYYIVQAQAKQRTKIYAQGTSKGSQKAGEGVNKYSYWVTNNIFDEWTELPQITREQLIQAKKTKRMLIGNLQAKVEGFPLFEGKQKHYLKCQLVRITHACEIAPKGLFKPHDENPKLVIFEDQQKMPEFSELASLQNWNHINPYILHMGRCSHWVDPELSEQQKEAAQAQLAEKDPEMDVLKPISEDKAVPEKAGVQNPWYIKTYGDTQIFTKDDTSLVYGVVALRNIHWPGWITVANRNGYAHIYVGNLNKAVQDSINPLENKDLLTEAEDAEEYPQPNPKQLPPPPAEEKLQDPAEPSQ